MIYLNTFYNMFKVYYMCIYFIILYCNSDFKNYKNKLKSNKIIRYNIYLS